MNIVCDASTAGHRPGLQIGLGRPFNIVAVPRRTSGETVPDSGPGSRLPGRVLPTATGKLLSLLPVFFFCPVHSYFFGFGFLLFGGYG